MIKSLRFDDYMIVNERENNCFVPVGLEYTY